MTDIHIPRLRICPICETNDTFRTLDDFKRHMYGSHTDGAFTEAQLETLAEMSIREKESVIFTECPFCGFTLEETSNSGRLMLRHISNHLEVISLMSIPWSMSLESEGSHEMSSFLRGSTTRSMLSWKSTGKASSNLSRSHWDDERGFVLRPDFDSQHDLVLQHFMVNGHRSTSPATPTSPSISIS